MALLRLLVATMVGKFSPKSSKKAKDGFLWFCQEQRLKLRAQNPTLTNSEITKMIVSNWKNASVDVRNLYKQKSEDDKQRFDREHEAYIASKPIDQPTTSAAGVEAVADPQATMD